MTETPAVVARRHRRILEIARATGSVSVDALAADLDVTPQTIRRDLNQLAGRALLSRVHGGAIVTSGVDNLDREARRQIAAEAKGAIGVAAAALVPDGASILINIGTTVETIAHALRERRHLLVVTNNLNVADILAGVPTIEVLVAGGRVRAADRAVVGPLATEFIRGFRTDYALIGASAIDADGTLLDFDADEVHVSQTIIARARSVILAADSTKFGRAAPIRIAGIEAVDHFITDRLDPALAEVCAQAGVTVIETD